MEANKCSDAAEAGTDFPTQSNVVPTCPAFFDGIRCWLPATNGSTARLPCYEGADAFAFRVCHKSGRWLGLDGQPADSTEQSYSNYSACITQFSAAFMKNKSISEIFLIDMAVRVNEVVEIVGDILSCVFLACAVLIFFRCSCLRNQRTKVHRNLFMAMLAQTLLHLLLASREILLSRAGGSRAARSLKALPYLCILLKCIWETTRTSIFAWMLAEGINIHDRISVTVFQTNTEMWRSYLLGYGLPVIPTIAWASVVLWRREHTPSECWKESFFSQFYWILNACRLCTFAINIGFLLNVLRVLVMRLRENRSNETQQMRKALRAAFLLLPLLGITNVICTVPDPVQTVEFVVVTTLKSCLLSFQGLFLALMYCFLDKEVQAALSRLLARHRMRRRRISGGGGGGSSRRGGDETLADEAGFQLTSAICKEAESQQGVEMTGRLAG